MSLLEMIAALGNACYFGLPEDFGYLGFPNDSGDGYGCGYGFIVGDGDTEMTASDYQCRL